VLRTDVDVVAVPVKVPPTAKFLARLLGINESQVASIRGLTFELSHANKELASFKELLEFRVNEKVRAVGAALAGEDDLGKIVRGHIYIEHELQDLIFFAAPNPDELERFDKIEYSEKVKLALVLGLDPLLKSALSAVGSLRNKFSHRLDMKLGIDQANNLVASLPPLSKRKFQTLLKEALSQIPEKSSLRGEGLAYFQAQTQVLMFFLALFHAVAGERHRLAFEKLGSGTV
jgi:hypothetical protein